MLETMLIEKTIVKQCKNELDAAAFLDVKINDLVLDLYDIREAKISGMKSLLIKDKFVRICEVTIRAIKEKRIQNEK